MLYLTLINCHKVYKFYNVGNNQSGYDYIDKQPVF